MVARPTTLGCKGAARKSRGRVVLTNGGPTVRSAARRDAPTGTTALGPSAVTATRRNHQREARRWARECQRFHQARANTRSS